MMDVNKRLPCYVGVTHSGLQWRDVICPVGDSPEGMMPLDCSLFEDLKTFMQATVDMLCAHPSLKRSTTPKELFMQGPEKSLDHINVIHNFVSHCEEIHKA